MKITKKNRLLFILGGVLVVLFLILIIAKNAGWTGKEEGMKVETFKAARLRIVEKVSASGRIQPVTEVKISSDVSGEIVELFVNEGDSVKKGQLLLKIRPDNYISMLDQMIAALNTSKAQEAQAKSRLAQVEAQFTRSKLENDRQKKLYQQKVISDADFELASTNFEVVKQDLISAKESVDAAKFSVQSSEARVREAKENLRRTSIYAPMSGVVSKQSVELGERVVGTIQMTGTEMLRIANLNVMEVRVNVNENDVVRIQLGDTAEIEVDAYSAKGDKFKGVVTEIANTAKEAISMDAVTEFEVRVRLINESYAHLKPEKSGVSPFRPGMTASVDIITEMKESALAVPLAAVTTRTASQIKEKDKKAVKVVVNGESNEGSEVINDKAKPKDEELKEIVFVLGGENKNKAEVREVKTGISDFEHIEIISGINDGDEVVSGPFLAVSKTLKNGALVKTDNKREPGKSKEQPKP